MCITSPSYIANVPPEQRIRFDLLGRVIPPPPPDVPPEPPVVPPVAQPASGIYQSQVRQNAATRSQASGTQQAATGQGGGSTMLTDGVGVDPNTLALGNKTLLGG